MYTYTYETGLESSSGKHFHDHSCNYILSHVPYVQVYCTGKKIGYQAPIPYDKLALGDRYQPTLISFPCSPVDYIKWNGLGQRCVINLDNILILTAVN